MAGPEGSTAPGGAGTRPRKYMPPSMGAHLGGTTATVGPVTASGPPAQDTTFSLGDSSSGAAAVAAARGSHPWPGPVGSSLAFAVASAPAPAYHFNPTTLLWEPNVGTGMQSVPPAPQMEPHLPLPKPLPPAEPPAPRPPVSFREAAAGRPLPPGSGTSASVAPRPMAAAPVLMAAASVGAAKPAAAKVAAPAPLLPQPSPVASAGPVPVPAPQTVPVTAPPEPGWEQVETIETGGLSGKARRRADAKKKKAVQQAQQARPPVQPEPGKATPDKLKRAAAPVPAPTEWPSPVPSSSPSPPSTPKAPSSSPLAADMKPSIKKKGTPAKKQAPGKAPAQGKKASAAREPSSADGSTRVTWAEFGYERIEDGLVRWAAVQPVLAAAARRALTATAATVVWIFTDLLPMISEAAMALAALAIVVVTVAYRRTAVWLTSSVVVRLGSQLAFGLLIAAWLVQSALSVWRGTRAGDEPSAGGAAATVSSRLHELLLALWWSPRLWAVGPAAIGVLLWEMLTSNPSGWVYLPLSCACAGGHWLGVGLVVASLLLHGAGTRWRHAYAFLLSLGAALVRFGAGSWWRALLATLTILAWTFVFGLPWLAMALPPTPEEVAARAQRAATAEGAEGAEGEVARIIGCGDHYAVLELTRPASDEDVKRAVRAKRLLVHPDKTNNAPGSAQAFRRVQDAAGDLASADSRAAYERTLAAAERSRQAEASAAADPTQREATPGPEADFHPSGPATLDARCPNCNGSHAWRLMTDRCSSAARYCKGCSHAFGRRVLHPAVDGDVWAERTGFFGQISYFVFRGGFVFEFTSAARCMQLQYANLEPDSHYDVVHLGTGKEHAAGWAAGKRRKKGRR